MNIEDALKSLSESHGSYALSQAFHVLQRSVSRKRKADRATWGALAAAYKDAMQFWDAQKAAGEPLEARRAGMEGVLRDLWPKGRDGAWKYICSHCDDYGLTIQACEGDATCGRTSPHLPHSFGVPCFCPKGSGRFCEKPKPSADDSNDAGKSSRPRRIGR